MESPSCFPFHFRYLPEQIFYSYNISCKWHISYFLLFIKQTKIHFIELDAHSSLSNAILRAILYYWSKVSN